jgi:CTP:molybdopterin cytidylyltransferase MocA
MSMAAVILAAGHSRRMGRFKPLLKLGDRSVIERAVSLFREAGLNDIRVVAGHAMDLLVPLLEELGVRIIANLNYDEGMFSSVTAALKNLEPDIQALFILPADIPLVSIRTIHSLLKQHEEYPDRILIPSFHGKRGHPVLIPAHCFEAIRQWHGEHGLKGALGQFSDSTVSIPVDDRNILFDLDTPDDYEKAKRLCTANPAPVKTATGRPAEGL